MSLHFEPLKVRAVERDTDDAVVVSFDLPEAQRERFRFQPGQYLTLRHLIDGQDVRRSYSICAGSDDPALRVGVRRVPEGLFSNWIGEALKPGDTIEVFPPQGHFCIPPVEAANDAQRGRHFLAIAGGSGITPILSIMKTVLAREPDSRVTLIYGNRRTASTMFREEIEDLKNRYLTRLSLHHVFSREQQDAPLAAGRIDRAKVAQFFGTVIQADDIDHVFVCGPFEMNDEVDAALREAGVPAERIHIERFGVPPAAKDVPAHVVLPDDADLAKVVIVRDGFTHEFQFRKTDPSILDAAAAAGLEVPYSCKSGVCSTCRARLIEGKVRMDRNFALEAHEIAAGHVLTCQAHPLTDRVVLSFDDR